ncbi:MAG TPA: DUF2000 domain-containing protein [Alphaproteobacteria bacterium]|nr:DUF2000 domain-containing protein [Alphaproteobacteria bacterium]
MTSLSEPTIGTHSSAKTRPPIRFDTKIAIVLRDDLASWQKLNVAAFLASGIAGGDPDVIGQPYDDASGNGYLAMFRQPVLVFAGSGEAIRAAYDRAMARGLRLAIFTEALFATGNDGDNRAAVRACPREALVLVGFAFRAERKAADKVLKGLALHR